MKRMFVIFAALVCGATSTGAQHIIVCMSTYEMEASLIDWYGETRVFQDSGNSDVFSSGVGGTWTLVTSNADGTSCAVAQGTNWTANMDADMLIAQLVTDNG